MESLSYEKLINLPLLFSVQLCRQASGTKGKLSEKASRGDHDQDGCTGQRFHEGQTEGMLERMLL